MKEGYFIGIDVSKETLDLSVVQGNQQIFYLRIANSTEGLKHFFKSCPKEIDLQGAVFCMEHTLAFVGVLHQQTDESSSLQTCLITYTTL